MVGKRRSTDSPEHCDLLHTKRTRSTSTEWSAAGPFSESQSELDLDPLLTEDTKPDIKPIVNQNDDMRTLQSQFDEMQESMRAMQESMKAIKAKMDQIQTGEQSPRSDISPVPQTVHA
ncbi:hypothetical protein AcW1_009382 [Taiwanofungus camphoratus]|nr:hypothetical protein AcW1_009382 [Antrodia cinnamomea]